MVAGTAPRHPHTCTGTADGIAPLHRAIGAAMAGTTRRAINGIGLTIAAGMVVAIIGMGTGDTERLHPATMGNG